MYRKFVAIGCCVASYSQYYLASWFCTKNRALVQGRQTSTTRDMFILYYVGDHLKGHVKVGTELPDRQGAVYVYNGRHS